MATLNFDSLEDARHHAHVAACGGCHKQGTLTAHQVRKIGPNEGRLFMKCGHCGRFTWLSKATPSEDGAAPQPAPRPKPAPPSEPSPPPSEKQHTERGLLADVADNPDDDGLRLIYADWLDEHGQPERAEFVRVQIRRTRLEPDDPAQRVLKEREAKLLAAHEAEWCAPLRTMKLSYRFARGFIDEVRVETVTFYQHADSLLRAAPAANWVVGAIDWTAVRALVRCDHFPRVRRLALVDGRIGGAGARILAESRSIANLRRLNLSENSLGQPGVAALAGSAYVHNLETLTLSGNNLSRSCVPILVSSPNLPRLRRLSLANNLLGNSDARSLATARRWPELRELDLSNNAFDNEAAEALAASPLLRQLVRLDLFDTDVSANGVRKIMQSPHARRELVVGKGSRR